MVDGCSSIATGCHGWAHDPPQEVSANEVPIHWPQLPCSIGTVRICRTSFLKVTYSLPKIQYIFSSAWKKKNHGSKSELDEYNFYCSLYTNEPKLHQIPLHDLHRV